MILKHSDIVQAKGLKRVFVEIPEWSPAELPVDPETGEPEKAGLYVRELTTKEKDSFENGMVKYKGRKQEMNLNNLRARLAVMVCCNEDWTPYFKPEDASWLGDKGCRALNRIYNAAQQLNGFTDEDEEELLKN